MACRTLRREHGAVLFAVFVQDASAVYAFEVLWTFVVVSRYGTKTGVDGLMPMHSAKPITAQAQ
jgi:hypothetical protein